MSIEKTRIWSECIDNHSACIQGRFPYTSHSSGKFSIGWTENSTFYRYDTFIFIRVIEHALASWTPRKTYAVAMTNQSVALRGLLNIVPFVMVNFQNSNQKTWLNGKRLSYTSGFLRICNPCCIWICYIVHSSYCSFVPDKCLSVIINSTLCFDRMHLANTFAHFYYVKGWLLKTQKHRYFNWNFKVIPLTEIEAKWLFSKTLSIWWQR